MNAKTLLITALLPIVSVVLVGCGASATDMESRGNSRMASDPASASRDYQSALERARREGASPDRIRDLEVKAAAARDAAAEAKRANIRNLIAQARAHAASHQWAKMLRAVETARKELDRTPDGAIGAELAAIEGSQIVKLARVAQAYAAMRREANWSIFSDVFAGDDWFTFWSGISASSYGARLVTASASTNDVALIEKAAKLSEAWNKYITARELSRAANRNGGDSWLDVAVGVGTAINEVSKGAKFDQQRKEFETHLNNLMNGTQFPGPIVQAAAPAAVAPAAPVAVAASSSGAGTGSGSAAGTGADGTGTGSGAPAAAASVANPADPFGDVNRR